MPGSMARGRRVLSNDRSLAALAPCHSPRPRALPLAPSRLVRELTPNMAQLAPGLRAVASRTPIAVAQLLLMFRGAAGSGRVALSRHPSQENHVQRPGEYNKDVPFAGQQKERAPAPPASEASPLTS
jgi:hypothetical protein